MDDKPDEGIAKGPIDAGPISYVILVFHCVAIYNAFELAYIICSSFKRCSGVYFWSCMAATSGIAAYSTSFIIRSKAPQVVNPIYVTLIVLGWICMVTGQSMVL
jgi:hypothetical protein